jgi:pimeloyl-[acyl-carrier protein] methyl ester esterase
MKFLVLLHGWAGKGAIWRRQVDAFGDGFEVLTPRIPCWDAGWLADYLADVDLAAATLVGWSLGGMLLLETLARIGSPAATVLVGVAPVFCSRPDHPWGQSRAALRAMRLGLRSEPARVIGDFAAAGLAPGEAPFYEEALAGFDFQADPAYLAQGLDYLQDKDLRGLLPRITGKVVIIQGGQDNIVVPDQARFLQKHLPGSELHLLPGAGHLPFLTQAEVLNGILREMLETE